jgi:hypothetical protein
MPRLDRDIGNLRTSASRQKRPFGNSVWKEPDSAVVINNALAIERSGGRDGGGPPMPVCAIDRDQRPWNKGLLIGQKKPLEPKHVWSIRVRLEIGRSRRDLVIFNLAIDSKLRACDLVKLRLDDVCSGVNVRHRATIVQKKTGDQSSSKSRSSRGVLLKPGYQCSAPPVPDISSQVDFMQVLTYQSVNMPGWCIAGLKASAWSRPSMVRTRCGVRRPPRCIARLATCARYNSSSAIRSSRAPSDILGLR